MWLSQLVLVNFRNYRRLGLDLEPGVVLFCGENGQGKTNLLEAVYVLATTRSPRTSTERELVTWQVDQGPEERELFAPFARVEGRVRRAEGDVRLEVLFKGETEKQAAAAQTATVGEITGPLARTIRVNGLPARATALIGHLPVVYFSPQDVALADGPPSARRQYLNIANSQVAPLHLRSLQKFNRVLLQRNQVLRQIRERRQKPSALDPWTEQLVRLGAIIIAQRLRMLHALNQRVPAIFRDLSGGAKELQVVYRSTLGDHGDAGSLPEEEALSDLTRRYRERQQELVAREIDQGASLVGPHRDDFSFNMSGVDLNVYGSRGQQRLAVLAMKLAEADWMSGEIGEAPVLLLDDVLSELDPPKRLYVLERVVQDHATAGEKSRQVWITTTDRGDFPSLLLERARQFNIDAGTVRRA